MSVSYHDINFYTVSLKKNSRVIAILPDDVTTPFQTLILFHNIHGDCTDWIRRSNIEQYAEDMHMAVIMPSGENSNFLKTEYGDDYVRYIGEDLMHFLSTIFPIYNDRRYMYVAGIGGSGYGAFHTAMCYPDIFGGAASMSGKLQIESFVKFLIMQDEKKCQMPELYLNCKVDDEELKENKAFLNKIQELKWNGTLELSRDRNKTQYSDIQLKEVMEWISHR